MITDRIFQVLGMIFFSLLIIAFFAYVVSAIDDVWKKIKVYQDTAYWKKYAEEQFEIKERLEAKNAELLKQVNDLQAELVARVQGEPYR